MVVVRTRCLAELEAACVVETFHRDSRHVTATLLVRGLPRCACVCVSRFEVQRFRFHTFAFRVVAFPPVALGRPTSVVSELRAAFWDCVSEKGSWAFAFGVSAGVPLRFCVSCETLRVPNARVAPLRFAFAFGWRS
jgi:hypothetical protein